MFNRGAGRMLEKKTSRDRLAPLAEGLPNATDALAGLHVERLRRRRTAESGCPAADPMEPVIKSRIRG